MRPDRDHIRILNAQWYNATSALHICQYDTIYGTQDKAAKLSEIAVSLDDRQHNPASHMAMFAEREKNVILHCDGSYS